VTPAAKPVRLFFALWPDRVVRAALARRAAAIERVAGGRATRAEAIHLTLAFLGATDPARLVELKDAAAGVRLRPFELVLDAAGFWKHNRIAWAGATAPPPALAALVSGVRGALGDARFPFDPKPFVPHLTLVRDARPGFPMPEFRPLAWEVADFVLVRSVTRPEASEYAIEGRWP
jgi:2'-5' RNA ligase